MLGRADLVVGVLDVDAELLEREHRLAPHVGARVERRQVEVAALVEHLGALGVLEEEVLELGADAEARRSPSPACAPRRGAGRGAGRPRRAGARACWMSANIRATPRLVLRAATAGPRRSLGSGTAIMSDSSIGLNPVIEEPSKPMPPSKASSSSVALIENDFSRPRMSVNQRRMKRMPCSSTSALTSSAVVGFVCSGRIRAGP